jgi:hypothetical protein
LFIPNRAQESFPVRANGPEGIAVKDYLYLGFVALLLNLGLVACDSTVGSEAVLAPADNALAASMTENRGSWSGWPVHDLPYGSPQYTDENGLRHEDYNIWPVIWPDYPSEESPVVYCTDGAEKNLVGGDGGSKFAAGTCRNDRYIIQIQRNASDAPAPVERSGWTALSIGDGTTLYYRLTPR